MMQQQGVQRAGPNNDVVVNNTAPDTITTLSWSPAADFFVAGSWANDIRCYQMGADGSTQPKAQQTHAAPVLCSTWSPDGTTVYSGSCDNTVKAWSLATNQFNTIAQHAAPVKEVRFIADKNVLVTCSWDKTVKYWDPRTPKEQGSVALSERAYCMDAKSPLLVVGTADQYINLFDLRQPFTVFKRYESVLKKQLASISCFPGNESGFAVGGLEGRVSVVAQVDDPKAKANFAFKCHRHEKTNGGSKVTEVFAVNSVSLHPRTGTLATAGSDGCIYFWDKVQKQRLKQFKRNPNSITVGAFNRTGNVYAYAISYDWSKGPVQGAAASQIMLHSVVDKEITPRPK